jgi:hypothetical protein
MNEHPLLQRLRDAIGDAHVLTADEDRAGHAARGQRIATIGQQADGYTEQQSDHETG